MTEEREAIHRRAIERERENRWNAKGRACVTHPKYGSVVVPHSSNLAALMNAAEYWGCDCRRSPARRSWWQNQETARQ